MNNKLLKQFNSCSTNDELISVCKEHNLIEMGGGSSRIVYAVSDSLVIKIARNNVGILQNRSEVQVMEYLKENNDSTIELLADIPLEICNNHFMFIFMERLVNANAFFDSDNTNEFLNNKHNIKRIVELDEILGTDIFGDLNEYQLGQDAGGKVKVLDYGFTNSAALYYTDMSNYDHEEGGLKYESLQISNINYKD